MSGINLAPGKPVPVNLYRSFIKPDCIVAEADSKTAKCHTVGAFRPLQHCAIIAQESPLSAIAGEVIFEELADTEPLPSYDISEESYRTSRPSNSIIRGVFSELCLHCTGCQLFQNYVDYVGLEEVRFQQTLS